MTAREFCYWLQGYFELNGPGAEFTETQVQMVRSHLNLVFKHEIDPSYPGDPQELQDIHDGSATQTTHPANVNIPLGKPPRPQIGGVDSQGNILRC